jgi:hypothetical protein
VLLVVVMLVTAGAACALNAPDRLNEGRGTRENPVRRGLRQNDAV